MAVFAWTRKIDETTYDALVDAKEVSGVLRNIWWEGMTRKNERFFRDQMGLNLADHISLIDYNANRRFGMYFGIPVVLVTAFFAYVFARYFHLRMTGF